MILPIVYSDYYVINASEFDDDKSSNIIDIPINTNTHLFNINNELILMKQLIIYLKNSLHS